jgi:hypothetical protein
MVIGNPLLNLFLGSSKLLPNKTDNLDWATLVYLSCFLLGKAFSVDLTSLWLSSLKIQMLYCNLKIHSQHQVSSSFYNYLEDLNNSAFPIE